MRINHSTNSRYSIATTAKRTKNFWTQSLGGNNNEWVAIKRALHPAYLKDKAIPVQDEIEVTNCYLVIPVEKNTSILFV